MEATNSSLEDFVKLVMGRLILWHRQRLLKTPIKEKKNEKRKLESTYIYSIYIKWCYLSHNVFLFFKVFWGMMLGSNTKYPVCDFLFF